MILCQDIKIGTCINLEGQLYFCIDFLHVKPGKGNTFVRTKLKNVVNGRVLERTKVLPLPGFTCRKSMQK